MTLQEIDYRLTKLKEYLWYRADYIVRNNPHVTIQITMLDFEYTPEQMMSDLLERGFQYYSTLSAPRLEVLLGFEEWLQFNKQTR